MNQPHPTSQQQQQQQHPQNAPSLPPQLPPTPTKMNNTNVPGEFALKKLLPIAAFFMGFATVMTLLVIYINNKALLHHQFNINMTQDADYTNLRQDDPGLVDFIKTFILRPAVEPKHKQIEFVAEAPTKDIEFILKLLHNKMNGIYVEAGAYGDGKTSETEWLEKKLNWRGLLVQPDSRHYFNLNRHNRIRSQSMHGCLSPTPYPREITYHQEDGVKINSINSNLIDESGLFITRVKCFPLYSLLLAMNLTEVDFLSIEARGTELQILETIPFERVKITFIDVHLLASDLEKDTIQAFLANKNYTLIHNFNTSYIYKANWY